MNEMQMAMFDRDLALAQVEAGTPVEVLRAMQDAALRVARRQQFWISDDCRDELKLSGVSEHREPRAWGVIMSKLAKAGIIHDTGRTKDSRRRSRHAGPERVWTSSLYGK